MMVWLDTRHSKKGNAQRELCPRADGAVQPRHRPLHREGHPRGRPRLHRLGDPGRPRPSSTPTQHDDGDKTVLGQTGNWKGEDIVRICLEQKSAPALHRRQAVPLPRQRDRAADAGAAGAAGGAVPQERLRLRRPGRRRCCVEPVLLADGVSRHGSSRRSISPWASSAAWKGTSARRPWPPALEELGQNLFYPPSVKGWDGGQTWLNGQTLLFRQNLALALTSTEDTRFGRRTDPAALARKHDKKSDDELVDFFLTLFLQGDVPAESRRPAARLPAAQPTSRRVPGLLDRRGRGRPPRARAVSPGADVAGISTGLVYAVHWVTTSASRTATADKEDP